MRCMAAVVCLTALAASAAPSFAEPGDTLWAGQVAIESGGNPRAFNSQEGAAGIVQIRPVALADINRIARASGLAIQYSPSDRFNVARAREMWNLYLAYYGQRYAEETGRDPTDEVYARIWNGGPLGWKKEGTRDYWRRVRAAMPPETGLAVAVAEARARPIPRIALAAAPRPTSPATPVATAVASVAVPAGAI